MTLAVPPAVPARRDVRMDGVYFCRLVAHGAFAKTLEPGHFSYCVMVRAGRLRFETDFPAPMTLELEPGDALAVSGLDPHVFRAGDEAAADPPGRFDRRPLADGASAGEVDIVLGVAPNETLALGSLTLGPILVRPAAHPALSRRLWAAVAMLEDEYADPSWIDHDLVVRRLAETMAINMTRCAFDARRERGEQPPAPASRNVVRAISAFLRAPERLWTLAELARAAGMSRTRFAEEFKLVTGQTPARILSRLRLTAVARRLASAALSVEAAAEEAGYSSAAAFVRAFQREFGETPARWRRRRTAEPGARSIRSRPRRRAKGGHEASGQRREAP